MGIFSPWLMLFLDMLPDSTQGEFPEREKKSEKNTRSKQRSGSKDAKKKKKAGKKKVKSKSDNAAVTVMTHHLTPGNSVSMSIGASDLYTHDGWEWCTFLRFDLPRQSLFDPPFQKITHPWRSCAWNDSPCDGSFNSYGTLMHLCVSCMTGLFASLMVPAVINKKINDPPMTHLSRGSRGVSLHWQLH